jgi:uncharacterized protein (TIGR03083 family)
VSQEGVAGARAAAEDYRDVVVTLSGDEWSRPSQCPGWSVKDLVAHTSSNFKVLVEPPPAAEPVPGMTAERAQDALVDQRREWSPEQVREEFQTWLEPALGVLEALQDPSMADQPITLHDLGTYPMAALADAFAFDLYCHLRVDLLRPMGAVDRDLSPADETVLRPAIGWMLTGLPQMCRGTLGVVDRPVGLRLVGPGGGEHTVLPGQPLVEVAPGLRPDAAAVVTSSVQDFVVWGTGRRPWRESVTVSGDEHRGARFLDAVDIV